MQTFARDLAFAGRTLRKNPAFALTAILTLALGIGATTAIFSVVNTVLLRPLPYDHPERLTIIWGELRTRKVYDWSFAPGDLKDLMDQATLFEGIAGLGTNAAPLIVDGAPPQQIQVAFATPNVFSVLGVKVARGRGFTADDGIPQPRPQQNARGSRRARSSGGAGATTSAHRRVERRILATQLWRRSVDRRQEHQHRRRTGADRRHSRAGRRTALSAQGAVSNGCPTCGRRRGSTSISTSRETTSVCSLSDG